MKIAVVSYSLTGNNEALAKMVAERSSADHIKITEALPRKTGKIIGDSLFGTTPKVWPAPSCIDAYDLVVFVSPVWLGQAASPLRPYLQRIKDTAKQYAFFSICGGALGPNPKLKGDLTKRTGAAPAAFADLHIADLLPIDKPTMKDTSAYRLNSADAKKLAGRISGALQSCMVLA